MSHRIACWALALAAITAAEAADRATTMSLSSPAFARGAAIPKRHTCDGPDVSPALAWSGAPAGTRSFVLIVEDPDAQDFAHWLIFNLPPGTTSLPATVTARNAPRGATEGLNDFGATGYKGPCPPSGRHRYAFRLYALDIATVRPDPAEREQLLDAIKGHVLGEARLDGTYQR